MKNQNGKEGAIIKYVFFLINPILGFLISLKEVKSKTSFNVFFLFTILFGICFIVPSGRTADFTGDGAVYRLRFDRMAVNSSSDFDKVLKDYLEFEEGEKDFYVTALSFIVSRFTDNYHYMFAIFAFIFGFFMLKSLKILTDVETYSNNSFYCFLIVTVFILSNSLFNINGVRFWTASWIAVYCIFQIFLFNRTKYFFLALLTPFVHVSFFVFVLILIIGYYTRKFSNFWFVLFLLSFLISSFAQDLLKLAGNILPSFISRTIQLYTDDSVVLQMKESKTWFVELFMFLERVVVNLSVFLFYRKKEEIKKYPIAHSLFLFILIWMTFVNFSISVPSLGGRFLRLSLPMLMYVWVVVWQPKKIYFTWLIIFLLAFSIDFLYEVRSILKVTEMDFYIFSPIYLVFKYLF